MRIRGVLAAAAALAVQASGVVGQVTFAPRADIVSSYVWRGLSIVNRPVIQPQGDLSAGPVTLSAWANVEPVGYHGATALSALAGRRAPGFTEADLTLEVAHQVGAVSLAAGNAWYLFTHSAGVETAVNTGEVYGRVGVGGPLPLEVTAYYDVLAVRGMFLDLSTERALPGLPLVLGARAGASFGEQSGPRTSYYERDGLTDVEFSAAIPAALGRISVRPSLAFDVGLDPATRIVDGAGRSARSKLRFGVGISGKSRE